MEEDQRRRQGYVIDAALATGTEVIRRRSAGTRADVGVGRWGVCGTRPYGLLRTAFADTVPSVLMMEPGPAD